MSKILVVGGCGFVGSHLAKELSKDHHVVVLDDLSHNGNLANLNGVKCSVVYVDISFLSIKDWMKMIDSMDVVFHQAAITDTTCKDEKLIRKINFDSSYNLAMACISRNIPLIYASSASVYGNKTKIQKESSPTHPDTLYAQTKLDFDRLALRWIAALKDQQIVGLRYFNVYGPNEHHKGKMMSYLHQMLHQAKADCRIELFTDGNQVRDFVHVDDVVQANIKAWKSGKSGIFNVGSGQGVTFNQIHKAMEKTFGGRRSILGISWIENPHKHYQGHTCADISKAKKAFGYKPKYDLKKGLNDLLERCDYV